MTNTVTQISTMSDPKDLTFDNLKMHLEQIIVDSEHLQEYLDQFAHHNDYDLDDESQELKYYGIRQEHINKIVAVLFQPVQALTS